MEFVHGHTKSMCIHVNRKMEAKNEWIVRAGEKEILNEDRKSKVPGKNMVIRGNVLIISKTRDASIDRRTLGLYKTMPIDLILYVKFSDNRLHSKMTQRGENVVKNDDSS